MARARLVVLGLGILPLLLASFPCRAQTEGRGPGTSRTTVVVVVRPSGSPIEQALIARVEERLASRRVSLVHVGELRERIGRIAAGRENSAALELAAARALELDARFAEAADRYGRAVRALLCDPRSLADPRRVAETELARGAALLENGDEPAAVTAMQAALGHIEDLQVDATFSPNARAALEKARIAGPIAAELPASNVFATAMRASDARFIVHVTTAGPRSARTMRAVVRDAAGRELLDERRSMPRGRDRAVAHEAAERIAGALAARIPLPPAPPSRPIWTNPFFLGAVGVVVAGGVAATLYFTATEKVTVRLER
ncbi:MAG: hypothetical protein HYY06_00570 [Deltaproteobacteria bacterium]|nr:hypothetical protein [Deltaproteobacteria bacterium]